MRKLLLLAFIWGWSFLFIKVAVEGLTPVTVAWARIALGALVLHATLRHQGLSLPRDGATWRHFTIIGLTACAIPFTMLAWSEQHITSALTSVLNASTPLFTAVAAAVLLRDRLRPIHVAGLLLGIAGVAVAAGVGSGDLAGSSVTGALAAVGAGAFYGLAFAYIRKHLTGLAPVVAAAGQLTVASIALTPFAIATSITSGVTLTPIRVLCVAVLGIVGTGVAYVISYGLIAEVGATKASLVTYLIPVVAVLVGVVVLSEPFALRLVAGGLMIVAGIAVIHDRIRIGGSPPTVGAVTVLVVVAMVAAGCGGDGSSSSGCGPVTRERLDPDYLVHTLPGAPEPTYLSDPPTSGPHQPSPDIKGVVAEPLSRPVQVGLLETGKVLVQLQPGLPDEDVAALGGLAGDQVVVAPNADLDDPIVATAWVTKRTCRQLDINAVREFVDARVGKGPK